MDTIDFRNFRGGIMALVHIGTVPFRLRPDYQTRNENLTAGKSLCERCDGTGNEMYSSYRACEDCWGSGIAPNNPTNQEE
jgi:hypothetical protein